MVDLRPLLCPYGAPRAPLPHICRALTERPAFTLRVPFCALTERFVLRITPLFRARFRVRNVGGLLVFRRLISHLFTPSRALGLSGTRRWFYSFSLLLNSRVDFTSALYSSMCWSRHYELSILVSTITTACRRRDFSWIVCAETQGATQKLGGRCLSPACTGIPVKKGMLYIHGIVLFHSGYLRFVSRSRK